MGVHIENNKLIIITEQKTMILMYLKMLTGT